MDSGCRMTGKIFPIGVKYFERLKKYITYNMPDLFFLPHALYIRPNSFSFSKSFFILNNYG